LQFSPFGAFEITFYIVDSSVIGTDAILGRDLLNHKGIQICTDSHGTRLYLNNVKNIHNVVISTETVHTPLKNEDLRHLMDLLSRFNANITTGNSVLKRFDFLDFSSMKFSSLIFAEKIRNKNND
jgi:hypothetical protein